MESIPTEYLILIYILMALPFIVAILGVVLLIIVAVLYFTNRRKTALKISQVTGIVILILIAFAWLTKSSLGI
jgi:hypothetical protein